MELFRQHIHALRSIVYDEHKVKRICADPCLVHSWPKAHRRDVILSAETGLELGSPQHESVSFLVWTDDRSLIEDNLISLVGPDFQQCKEKSISFGKVAIILAHGSNEHNAYDRYRQLQAIRFSLDLKGYMIRASSQYQREWSRLSHQATKNGFSVQRLGSVIIDAYKSLDYVDGAELFFITQTPNLVINLKPIASKVQRRIYALNKKILEQDFDCDQCEYNDICENIFV